MEILGVIRHERAVLLWIQRSTSQGGGRRLRLLAVRPVRTVFGCQLPMRTTGTRDVRASDIVFRVRRFAKLSSSERKTEEMYDFVFDQSHISEKNMDRLRVLLDDPDEGVQNVAFVLIRVAAIRPYRRKRLKYLLKVDWTLAQDFVETFLGGEWIDVE